MPRDGSGGVFGITDFGDANPVLTGQAFSISGAGDRVVTDTASGTIIAAYLDQVGPVATTQGTDIQQVRFGDPDS